MQCPKCQYENREGANFCRQCSAVLERICSADNLISQQGDLYNILVVDDEVSNLHAMERIFRREYNVFSATNGEDALAIMEQNAIALVIADHRMPGMTGVEFLEKTLQKHPDTIRIILTAYTDEKLLMAAINTGRVHGFLNKPWEPEEIKSTVREGIKAYEASRVQRNGKKTIGEILVENEMISRSQLDAAIKLQEPGRKPGEALVTREVISPDEFKTAIELQLAETLVGLGYVDERDIFLCYALQLGADHKLLSQISSKPELARLLPLKLAYKYSIVPVDIVSRALVVAAPEPLSDRDIRDIEQELGRVVIVRTI